jgi:hypothetical protein
MTDGNCPAIAQFTAADNQFGTHRVVEHHVNAARNQLDCTGVRRVGMDETSARKGQDYVSIFADLDARRVLFACKVPKVITCADAKIPGIFASHSEPSGRLHVADLHIHVRS